MLQISLFLFVNLLMVTDSAYMRYNTIVQFVTVDYLWDTNHSRSSYEASGNFIVANKVSKTGDIYVSVPRWKSGVPSSLNKLVRNPNGNGYVLSPWSTWQFNQINNSESLNHLSLIVKIECGFLKLVGQISMMTIKI